MDDPNLEQLKIEVSASDATEADIDLMTRQLLYELRQTDVDSAELAKGGVAPHGTKSGDAVTVGSIVISALPTVLPGIVRLVQDWAARGQGRRVKFKGQIGGGTIEFEGSPQELQKLLDSLEARQRVPEAAPVENQQEVEKAARSQTRTRPARSPRIFLSYRRADSADVTGRIYDRLAAHFGENSVFKDVDSIPPGIDFKEHLEKAVGKCKIFLAVIGDKWLEDSRIHDTGDFVRIELEAALNRNILVIPLLVRGASMPAEEKLPPSLGKLAYRNAMSIRPDPDFHRDMDRLIEAISNYFNKRS